MFDQLPFQEQALTRMFDKDFARAPKQRVLEQLLQYSQTQPSAVQMCRAVETLPQSDQSQSEAFVDRCDYVQIVNAWLEQSNFDSPTVVQPIKAPGASPNRASSASADPVDRTTSRPPSAPDEEKAVDAVTKMLELRQYKIKLLSLFDKSVTNPGLYAPRAELQKRIFDCAGDQPSVNQLYNTVSQMQCEL